MKKKKLILFFLVIIAIAIKFAFFNKKKEVFNINDFDIEYVTRGNIEKVVEATGTINPVNIVDVGSQVSGIIKKIYVDYNSVVKKNQLLAILDTDILEKNLKESESNLKKAKAQLNLSKLEHYRNKELYKNNYISKADLDTIEAKLVESVENYKIAKSVFDKSKIQLKYAYIKSPVSGTVITKSVEEGQTVASSLSTPVLFKIAEDLKKMQIETSVSEADIGMIRNNKNLKIRFNVDAYKNKTFEGKMRQARLNYSLESNVVVYNVVIDINNDDGLLLPGMTAYVSILTDSSENVLRIPNTALRFKANDKLKDIMDIKPLTNEEKYKLFSDPKYSYIYVLDKNDKPRGIIVEKGLSDINFTEIKTTDLKEGDRILSAYLVKKKK